MKKNILIVILLIVICCLGFEVYNLSKDTTPVDETEITEPNYKIEGLYCESVEAGDPPTYEFNGNKVIWDGYETYFGEFEIEGNKVKITYTSGKNFDGDDIEISEENKTEEFTIIDNDSLQSKNTKIVRYKEAVNVKE